MSKNKVPLEACVKYLVMERDNYKAKLDILVPYTKSLEASYKALKEEKDKEHEKELLTLQQRLESLEKQNLRLQEENSNLIKDYRKSEWFAQIERNHKKRQQTINELRHRLNSLYLEKNND